MEDARNIPELPSRRPKSHKGNYGRVLVIGGSEGMVGAACLATSASLRSGAGLTTLAISWRLLPVASSKLTCALTHAIEKDTENAGPALGCVGGLIELATPMDVVVIGPGIGRHCSTEKFVHAFLRRCDKTIVLDADGLTALASDLSTLRERRGLTVLTPHPGEMGRLCGKTASEVNEGRTRIAADFAREYGCVVVLKGHETVVAEASRIYVNKTGNPGMATGGAGDVLSGAIGGLLAQGMADFEAAQLGVYLHGIAGDLCKQRVGEYGMTAVDILDELPGAITRHREGS